MIARHLAPDPISLLVPSYLLEGLKLYPGSKHDAGSPDLCHSAFLMVVLESEAHVPLEIMELGVPFQNLPLASYTCEI